MVQRRYDGVVNVSEALSKSNSGFRTHDERLRPIADKVFARQRLSFEDGLALYGSADILAVGWLANWVRESLYGDITYFNVNRHINPTNVCVAVRSRCTRRPWK